MRQSNNIKKIVKQFTTMRRHLLIPASAILMVNSVQATNLISSFDFNNGEIIDKVTGISHFDTGNVNHGQLVFSTTAKSGLALEVDFLRYLRLPLSQVANSNGEFTVKFDYYHIRSTPANSTAWHAHSFAIRDQNNGYVWSHGFRNLNTDFWSFSINGFSKQGAQIKGDANAIPDFNQQSWHEYVLVFKDNRITWYVDGVFAYYQEFDKHFSAWDWSQSDIMLGARYQDNSLELIDGADGYLGSTGSNTHLGSVNAIFDNVRIWDSALDASTVTNGVEALIPDEPYLVISSPTASVSSQQQQIKIDISSNQSWLISEIPAWISIDKTSGNGTDSINLTISANQLVEARQAELKINNTSIHIIQSAELALDTADAIIYPDSQNQKIEYMFFDLKSSYGQAFTEATADNLFLVDGFNGVRTSIYGTQDKPDQANGKPAHPAPGEVVAEYYAPEVTKIKQALSRNPELIVFASKKLNGEYSFPDWVKQANGIDPEKYAIMLADYIEYMASEGIPTHILGVDNEYVFNEGKIWPDRFQKIVANLKDLAVERNFPMPQIIGYEDYNPALRNWMRDLNQNGWLNSMDIYGTHYYPKDRTTTGINNLRTDISYSGFKDRWHSELHWDTKSDIDDILEIEDGMGSMFDMTDHGFNGLMWWSYSRNNLRGNIMRKLMSNILDYSPVMTEDHDGVDILQDGNLHTRIFRKGDMIRGWVLNLNQTNEFTDYTFGLNNRTLGDSIYFTQYSEAVPWGVTGQAQKLTDNLFSLSMPPMTVTTFSFNLNSENDQQIINETWDTLPTSEITDNSVIESDIVWRQQSSHQPKMYIVDNDGPLEKQALNLQSLNEGETSSIATNIEPALIDGNYTALTLNLKVVFNQFNPTAAHASFVDLVDSQNNPVYRLKLNASATDNTIAELIINGQQGSQTIQLGQLGEFEDTVPYNINLTITKTADNQTNVACVIYRNKINWYEDNQFVATAITQGTELAQFKITSSTGSNLSIDELKLTAESLEAATVEGDLDGNGMIERQDLMLFIQQLGKTSDDAEFNIQADLDQDGIISRRDYSIFYSIYRNQ